ncbi:hypothetical protein [Ferrimonas futtsuensis]|uniref:hypothetical protein n=1 Tax=Ferrimonas futtsuensis TaxID=364764 RepID=UPI0004800173|nr:hypothetical protein [Ferrimonas futtsuensis]
MSRLKKPLVIDNFYELLSLHRVIVEARFNQKPRDLDVRRGSHVVDLANRVVALLKESDDETDWDEWLFADEHPYIVETITKRITEDYDGIWAELELEDKPDFINYLAAPFKPSEELVQRLVDENT